ncbi:MAG TPA: MarR family transcriptional regulator [Candidatus Stackebrandtia faecavium]|nr:MarR family transcriptional regulator [Candidatus Stackebrandtia faecavium]
MHPQDETRWLNDEEQQAWLSLVGVAMRLIPALDRQLRRDADISHFEYHVLAALSAVSGHALRLSVLASMTESSLPRLSQVVDRLADKGWVRREPDPENRRFTLAVLTDHGYENLVEIAPGHVEEVRKLVFDPLTKAQTRQLGSIAERIMHAIDPDHFQHHN